MAECPVGKGWEPSVWWGGRLATDLVECVDLAENPEVLDGSGWWGVVIEFDFPRSESRCDPGHDNRVGRARAWRFADVRDAPLPAANGYRCLPGRWESSLSATEYVAAVEEIRSRIREGEVYQANLCRVLSRTVPAVRDENFGPYQLANRLAAGNPAPYAGVIDVPGLWLVSASPELFLRREADRLTSGPIKGTAPTAAQLLPKDEAENIMITDLVRNDLQRVCRPGTVSVPNLLAVEEHPGLVHLVTTISGCLREGVGWGEILTALCPPGSVSGAPKVTALQAIDDLEPVPRGPYCGAVGWIDADQGTAELAVGIRTFWLDQADPAGLKLRFGTGAGITWGSDPSGEWQETELKAAKLIGLAT